jgi:hypothetical protein
MRWKIGRQALKQLPRIRSDHGLKSRCSENIFNKFGAIAPEQIVIATICLPLVDRVLDSPVLAGWPILFIIDRGVYYNSAGPPFAVFEGWGPRTGLESRIF